MAALCNSAGQADGHRAADRRTGRGDHSAGVGAHPAWAAPAGCRPRAGCDAPSRAWNPSSCWTAVATSLLRRPAPVRRRDPRDLPPVPQTAVTSTDYGDHRGRRSPV